MVSFLLRISEKCPIELSYMFGICKRLNDKPFSILKSDNSHIKWVSGFYNIIKIFESLIGISLLRYGLAKRYIVLSNKRFDLYDILDEFALYGCISPSKTIKEIKEFINFVVRTAGVFSKNEHVLEHTSYKHFSNVKCSNLKLKKVSSNISLIFWNSRSYQKRYGEGKTTLQKLNLKKLSSFMDYILTASIGTSSLDDFTISCSFLIRILAIPGYCRSYVSVPPEDFKDVEVDKHGLAEIFTNNIIEFHNAAVSSGYTPVSPSDWASECLSVWRSTSAGVAPESFDILINGQLRKVKIKKKLAIGMKMGESGFTRMHAQKKIDANNPGTIGYRDVPGKATRLIYVLPIVIINLMVAITSHIVNYASNAGKYFGKFLSSIDASHIYSGPSSTGGVRILDNYSTIAVTGETQIMTLDSDLKNFDKHCQLALFRKPIFNALKKIYENDQEKFGPSKMSRIEISEYVHGEGRLHGSYWDNGRKIYLMCEKNIYKKLPENLKNLFIRYIPKKKSLNQLRKGRGARLITYEIGEIYLIRFESLPLITSFEYKCIKEYIEKCDIFLGWFDDGSDLDQLNSHGSGELTTLIFNSILNRSLQEVIYRVIKSTKLGKRLKVIKADTVGDDMEWVLELMSHPESPDEIDEFLEVLETTYGEMGHEFASSKFFFLPMSSEFVQTHGRYGLYIPKDLISIFASEKNRHIRDPQNMCYSFKRLLLSKISKGPIH